ncbi:hypothetical protein [Lysinibacillus xylanilyticus]|uniref:hypothetical protein n=1 Tax=Lysinibacillus xylanilyticus TaxID=582475 RepID=UPI003D959D44
MNEILEDYNNYLGCVPKGTVRIAEQLREDNMKEALSAIRDFSEGVLWLSQASDFLKRSGAHVELDILKIQEFLIQVNEGLEKQDYVLVADMFEYEIAPFFEEVESAKGLHQ